MMSVKEKFNEVVSFVQKCELTIPADAGLKSGWQDKQGRSTDISLQYVVYRWAQFAANLTIMLGAILDLHRRTVRTYNALYYAKSLLYLTNWVLLGNMVQSLVGAIVVTLAYRHWARGGEPMRAGSMYGVSKNTVDVYCSMYCIALNFTVFMVFGYWELMGAVPKAVSSDDRVMFGCFGLSVFLMLADLFAVRFPYKMATGLYSFGILFTYLAMTWVHFNTKSLDAYQNKPYIYPGLDWSKPLSSVDHAVSSIFILEIINCSMLWWFAQLRRLAVNKFNPVHLHHSTHHDTSAPTTTSYPAPVAQQPANFHDPRDTHHHHDHTHDPPDVTNRTTAPANTFNEPDLEKSKQKKKKKKSN